MGYTSRKYLLSHHESRNKMQSIESVIDEYLAHCEAETEFNDEYLAHCEAETEFNDEYLAHCEAETEFNEDVLLARRIQQQGSVGAIQLA